MARAINKKGKVMNIVVCMKQVPASSDVKVDEKYGTLIRDGIDTKTNPYDLHALECALKIKEKLSSSKNQIKVTVLTMGPAKASEMVYDAYAMGADDAVILSDAKFAGSDVLATSYTLSQGIKIIKDYDLIICGKQTTDGDTAQIGPAIAEHLNIPHVAWVNEIADVDENSIKVRQDLGSLTQLSAMSYPCLITVDNSLNVPRLPSYKLKRETAGSPIKIVPFDELPDKDLSRFGSIGSPTSVEKMFPPEVKGEKTVLTGSPKEKAESLTAILKDKKIIEV